MNASKDPTPGERAPNLPPAPPPGGEAPRRPRRSLLARLLLWTLCAGAVLVIAGQFDAGKALAMVAEAFGGIPRSPRVLDPPYTTKKPALARTQ